MLNAEFGERFPQQPCHFVKIFAADFVARMNTFQHVVGKAGGVTHDRSDKFRLMVDQLFHIDIFEIVPDLIGIQNPVIKSHHDFADGRKSTVFIEECQRQIFPECRCLRGL